MAITVADLRRLLYSNIYPINTIYRGVPQRFDKNHINYKVYFIFKPKLVQLSPVQAFSDTFELADGFVVYKQETKKGGKFRMSELNLFKDCYNKSYLSTEITKNTIKLLYILYKNTIWPYVHCTRI